MKRQCFLFLLLATVSSFSQQRDLKLWYDKPAGNTWENALPIGNGFLGAMVYGNVAEELLQLNEATVWSGSPNRNDNPRALDSLALIRQLILAGKRKEAERVANNSIITNKSHGQKFEPVGTLRLGFTDHDSYVDYHRELDLDRAVSTTTYSVNGVTFVRESFASLQDRVIVMRITASKPGSITMEAGFASTHPGAIVKTNSPNMLTIVGHTSDHETVKGMVNYHGIVQLRLEGGIARSTDTSLLVKKADAVTVYISIATNVKSYRDITANAAKRAAHHMSSALTKPYAKLLAGHIRSYRQYFRRVTLDLGSTEAANAPTDVRLKNFKKADDPSFAALYFQYGRYLLISSSQPGGQPANLQGIWNNKINPPWDSKYTININAEMNYWPAEKTNLAELHQPFLQMVRDMSITGRATAKTMYGARGWVAHHNTDLWRITGAVDGANWGVFSASAGWMSQHLWEHYLYSGDRKFLAAIYPVLKNAALFYVDYLVEHPALHWLVVNPDESPENAPAAHQGSALDAGVTMTNQIVFELFSTTINAARLLNTDKAFTDTLLNMRARLSPMHIGRYGQLQEWLDDVDDPSDHHRHVSHLYGLFPSNQISPFRTPELYSAARTTLMQRGDVSTGWSMGWKVNWWARLLDGNHAFALIQNQLSPVDMSGTSYDRGGGTYNNLFDAHPPFQIDGNFGCTSGIAEMLVQSADGCIHLLPGLPDAWKRQGSIRGLRAVGGFEIVELTWKEGRIRKLVVESHLGGNLRLRSANELQVNGHSLKLAKGQNPNPFYAITATPTAIISPEASLQPVAVAPGILYDVPTVAGGRYSFTPAE